MKKTSKVCETLEVFLVSTTITFQIFYRLLFAFLNCDFHCALGALQQLLGFAARGACLLNRISNLCFFLRSEKRNKECVNVVRINLYLSGTCAKLSRLPPTN